MQELLAPELESLAKRHADRPEVQLVLKGRQESDAKADGTLEHLPSRVEEENA